jgi:hypothetical protein
MSAGDIVTEHGAQILAAVSDGDLAPIRTPILNPEADGYGRGAGVIALGLLVAWEVPRPGVLDQLTSLLRDLPREWNHV